MQMTLLNQVRDVWAELLEVDPFKISLQGNFFDLGADSLTVQLAAERLTDVVGVEVDPIDLYEHPNIAALAQHLER